MMRRPAPTASRRARGAAQPDAADPRQRRRRDVVMEGAVPRADCWVPQAVPGWLAADGWLRFAPASPLLNDVRNDCPELLDPAALPPHPAEADPAAVAAPALAHVIHHGNAKTSKRLLFLQGGLEAYGTPSPRPKSFGAPGSGCPGGLAESSAPKLAAELGLEGWERGVFRAGGETMDAADAPATLAETLRRGAGLLRW
jgi:hypothetical protein